MGRRFQFVCELENNIKVYDDYAHHPTEIKAFISSARSKYPNYKLIIVYQGHTHSRTSTFLSEYIESLKEADEVYIMPTFSSVREEECNFYELLENENGFKEYKTFSVEWLLDSSNLIIGFLGAGDIYNEFIFLNKKVNY